MAVESKNQPASGNTELYSNSPGRGSGKKRGIAAACVAAAVVVCAIVGVAVHSHNTEKARAEEAMMRQAVETDRFYDGIVVQGVELGGMTMEEAKAAVQKAEESARGDHDVTITYSGREWKITGEDLDFSYDTDRVLEEAYQYGRDGELRDRYEAVESLRETPKAYDITAEAELDAVGEKLEGIAKEVERAPKDATVKSFDPSTEKFTFEEGQPGVTVDRAALRSRVESALAQEAGATVELPTSEAPFSVSAADLQKNLQKLGTYSTTSTNTANGNYNMQLAFSKINGTVVPAGATFSYLDTVGNTGKSGGYRQAGAILNGKLIQEYGGGICQTSTTLYGAALRSDMQIVERYNHSIKSTYCPIGQDAAVSYGSLDFKFKNPSGYPVYIAANMSGKVLTVTLYGWKSPDYDEIQVHSQQTGTVPAISTPKYNVDRSIPKGYMKLDADPRIGYKAAAQRVYYKNGQVVKTENLPGSYYRPAPAFYSIGPDTDPSEAKLIGKNGVVSEPASSSSVPSAPSEPPAPPASSEAASQAPSSAPAPEPPVESETPAPTPDPPAPEAPDPGVTAEPPAEDVLANPEQNPAGDPTSGVVIPE